MLENDLILSRFLDRRGDSLEEAEIAALDRLLDLTDNELWDIFSGRESSPDPDVRMLLDQLSSPIGAPNSKD